MDADQCLTVSVLLSQLGSLNQSWITGSNDDRCPNCLEGPETILHLNQGIDPGWVHLFNDGINDLESWFGKNDNTNKELGYWLFHYLNYKANIL